MRVFDELIQNNDRNQGNILWTSDFTMWLIDHTRAFRLGRDPAQAGGLARCDRGLLERLRAITPEALAAAVGISLTKQEQEALLAAPRQDREALRRPDRPAGRTRRPVHVVIPLVIWSPAGQARHGQWLASIEIDRRHLVAVQLEG